MEYSKPKDIIFNRKVVDKLTEIVSQPYVLKGFFFEFKNIDEEHSDGEKNKVVFNLVN